MYNIHVISYAVYYVSMNRFIVDLLVPTHRTQLLAVRWREPEPVPEVVAVDTPAHLTTTPVPVVRSFSLSGSHGSTASVGGNGNSGQLRQDGGEEEEKLEEEEEEEEREEEKEGSQKELPPSPPTPTPQLLIEALTASLKKVRHIEAHFQLSMYTWNRHA